MSVFVLNMERIDGFLNLNEILHVSHEKDIDKFLKKLKKNNKIKIIKKRKENANKQFVFSFIYNNERYYFKFDSLVDKNKDLVEIVTGDLKQLQQSINTNPILLFNILKELIK